ncbi:hypothetical protein ACFPRL_17195 [Pseudoclavibacter helvolus]
MLGGFVTGQHEDPFSTARQSAREGARHYLDRRRARVCTPPACTPQGWRCPVSNRDESGALGTFVRVLQSPSL